MEGVIVLPVLAIFFLLTVYGWSVFDKRVRLQEQTRSEVFFAAAHDCNGGGTTPVLSPTPLSTAIPPHAAGLAAIMPGSDGLGAAEARSRFVVTDNAQASARVQVGRWARSMNNQSHVLCNDVPQTGHWPLWFVEGDLYFPPQFPAP